MFPAYPWLVLAPVVGLAVYCATHLMLTRLLNGRSPYPALIGGFGPGLLATLVVSGIALSKMQSGIADVIGYGLLNLTTYGALGWGYFHFVNLCIASLRIRVLEEIVEAGGALPAATLQSLYNTEGVVGLRISRLTAGGHLVVRNERFYSGRARFLLAARLFDLLRSFILGANHLPIPSTPPSESERKR